MKKKYVQAMIAMLVSAGLLTNTVAAAVPEKEQTVYVNADETGKTEKIIVSNWLKNTEKADVLEDKSSLLEIKNVKGEESFSKNGDEALTWQANGKDIYYQGETDRELPVAVRIRYFLNGKETPAAEMAGKSGKVTMRIEYENHSVQQREICGKQESIYTPFLMMTGMLLPTEKFTNIEVTNGKVISDGQNQIVIGMGLPGLSESLKVSEIKGMEEKEIPDYVEIHADVEDFSLAMTATAVTTGTLQELGLDEPESFDKLEELLDTFEDSSKELVKGSSELADGAKTLADGSGSLDSGASQLEQGLSSYIKGAETLADGIAKTNQGAAALQEGVAKINQKKEALPEAVQELQAGAGQLAAGTKDFAQQLGVYTGKVQELSGGIGQLYQGVQGSAQQLEKVPQLVGQLRQGAEGAAAYINQALQALAAVDTQDEALKQQLQQAAAGLQAIGSAMQVPAADEIQNLAATLTESAGQLKNAGEALCGYHAQLNGGAKQLQEGAGALFAGTGQLQEGASQLSTGLEQLSAGAKSLTDGTAQLKNGASQLVSKHTKLLDGSRQLAAGGKELKDGAARLEDGAHALAEGMKKFDEEGVQKLTSLVKEEAKTVVERLKATADAERGYTAFDGAQEGSGKVKFIIETAGIE